MKIRTDFVTNSSSSSFVVEISFAMKDGRIIEYSAVGMDGEGDPVVGELYLYASPRQLGMCKSVQDMINLLKSSVRDVDYGDEENVKKLFDENDPDVRAILSGERIKRSNNEDMRTFFRREKEAHEEAQRFIREIETIRDMDDIKEIKISGDEQNYEEYERVYTYNRVTGEYLCRIVGEEFEKNGGSGGDIYFKDEFLAKKQIVSFDEYGDEYEDEYEDELELSLADLPIVISIEGTGYMGRIERIEHVNVGDKLILKADMENEYYDPVAIEVFNEDNQTLGYLCDTWAHPLTSIARIIDEVDAYVDSVTPLSARSKRAKYALMDVKIISKKG